MKTASHRDWVLKLLAEHEAALTRYAFRLLGEAEHARDVVQHAFLKLCEQSAEDLVGRERKWLFTVCRNRALDLLRMAGRKLACPTAEAIDRERWQEAEGREPDPATAAESDELSDILRRLLARLPAGQREAIELWQLGFTYREIARITNHQEGNIRVLVHRGLENLRKSPQVRNWLDEKSRCASRDAARASPR